MSEKKEYLIEFRGGKKMALVPLIFFIISCIFFFVILQVYEMDGLAIGGFVALIIGSLFAKDISKYWDGVVKGMSAEMANTLILILFIVSFFGKMMTRGGVAEGFVWIGQQLHLSGAVFCVFTFIATSILATATGTSIGTLVTGFPILYPSGILLGCHPLFLAGAIFSGAIFGDTIGPISDVTIASAGTQEYTKKHGSAEIGGIITSRLRYSLIAALATCVLFFIFGGADAPMGSGGEALLAEYSNPKGLLMLIPVVLLLIVAVKWQNIYMAITVGLVSGIAIALPTGIFTVSDILSAEGGVISGFMIDGIRNTVGTVAFLITLFGIIGVLQESGMMDEVIERLINSKLATTARGTELIILIGSTISGICMGGANGPACLMFGPVADRLGKAQKLHPYRRGHLLAGFASTIPVMIPFCSLFVIICNANMTSLVEEFSFIEPISPMMIPVGAFFCSCFFVVYLISIITGWGRIYEGPDGKPVKVKPVD